MLLLLQQVQQQKQPQQLQQLQQREQLLPLLHLQQLQQLKQLQLQQIPHLRHNTLQIWFEQRGLVRGRRQRRRPCGGGGVRTATTLIYAVGAGMTPARGLTVMHFGRLWAPSYRSFLILVGSIVAPVWLPFGSFGFPCGSLWSPFGSLWLPFCSLLVPFGSLLVAKMA